jgi:hypothetical protein
LIISVSVVVLLGVAVAVLIRKYGLKSWHAVTCVLFGFYLANTPQVAPLVQELMREVSYLLGGGL